MVRETPEKRYHPITVVACIDRVRCSVCACVCVQAWLRLVNIVTMVMKLLRIIMMTIRETYFVTERRSSTAFLTSLSSSSFPV